MTHNLDTSFDEGSPKNHKWPLLAYSTIITSSILSIGLIIITLLLDKLDLLRTFILMSQVSLLFIPGNHH